MFWANGGRRIIEKTFPDGSKNVWGFEVDCSGFGGTLQPLNEYGGDTLTWKWESDADLITLMLMKECFPNFNYLRILYLPYGREDRNRQKRSRCPLRYIGQFIQSLGFVRIVVVDPHSDLTMAYLGENAEPLYPVSLLADAALSGRGSDYDEYVVMFPDATAAKRYGEAWKGFPHIIGTKTRDMATGKLSNYMVVGGELARGKKVLIVDDICSYGGTFMMAGDAIRVYDPTEITLVVTHCEKSIFKGDIFKPNSPISRVVTTDSILGMDRDPNYYPGTSLTIVELPK